MVIANVLNFLIGSAGLRLFALLVRFPSSIVLPVVVVLCIAGAFAVENSMFSIGVMMVFAVLGYFMRKFDFSFATFIIGFALGESFEISFRQTVILFGDSPFSLLQHPIVVAFLLLTVFSIWRSSRPRRRTARSAASRGSPHERN